MIDNRAHERYIKEMEVEFSVSGNDNINKVKGKIVNISLGGIYIITDTLIEKNSKLDLKISFYNDDELIAMETAGNILRSGDVTSDVEINEKYTISPDDGKYFAAIKFFEPFIELSLIFDE